MKRILIIAASIILISSLQTKAQLLEIKPWHGSYPEMGDTYPLTFIAFKGWLVPVPHVFVRTWPTHYYIEADAMPVTDATEIGGATVTGLLRIAAKMLERHHMEGRHNETVQIKDNTDFQKQIGEKIFNARADQLEDLFGLAQRFIGLYSKIDRIGDLPNSAEVKEIFEEEADRQLMRFLMVNLLETGHGEKLEAFSEINTTLNKLSGEVDYTFFKIRYFSNYNAEITSYSFLTR